MFLINCSTEKVDFIEIEIINKKNEYDKQSLRFYQKKYVDNKKYFNTNLTEQDNKDYEHYYGNDNHTEETNESEINSNETKYLVDKDLDIWELNNPSYSFNFDDHSAVSKNTKLSTQKLQNKYIFTLFKNQKKNYAFLYLCSSYKYHSLMDLQNQQVCHSYYSQQELQFDEKNKEFITIEDISDNSINFYFEDFEDYPEKKNNAEQYLINKFDIDIKTKIDNELSSKGQKKQLSNMDIVKDLIIRINNLLKQSVCSIEDVPNQAYFYYKLQEYKFTNKNGTVFDENKMKNIRNLITNNIRDFYYNALLVSQLYPEMTNGDKTINYGEFIENFIKNQIHFSKYDIKYYYKQEVKVHKENVDEVMEQYNIKNEHKEEIKNEVDNGNGVIITANKQKENGLNLFLNPKAIATIIGFVIVGAAILALKNKNKKTDQQQYKKLQKI